MKPKHLRFLLLLAMCGSVLAQAETTVSADAASLADNAATASGLAANPDALDIHILSNGLATEDGRELPPLTDNQNNLWNRIKQGFGMSNMQSPSTSAQENWYASRPDYVNRMVGRSQRYLYHIVEEVEKRGMPTEIALLPMVESAFNPQAYSRARASGIWQFMPATGKTFGLKQTWWKDNRRDVMAATNAALNYLEKLHVMFGTWELALAAYNAGEGTVQRAIERNRRKGLPTDYESLDLPKETREYVPKLQAVKNIVNNPEQYGLDIQPIANQPYFAKVTTDKAMDARLAAKLAGISFDEFISLNPAYNRPVIAAKGGKHDLLLPVGSDEAFAENLANYKQSLVSWQTYTTQRGEKIDAIARKFGTTVAQLRDVNDLPTRSRIKAGQQILVPLRGPVADAEIKLAAAAEREHPAVVEMQSDTPSRMRYTVRKGDTLDSIAKRYQVNRKTLVADNHLKTSRLKPGSTLIIASAKASGGTAQVAKKGKQNTSLAKKNSINKTLYIVKRGETLTSIARKFNVATSDLQRWNKLGSARLNPGHKLTIYKPDAA